MQLTDLHAEGGYTMENTKMSTTAAEAVIGNILMDISDTAEAVICEANNKVSKILLNRSAGHYISKLIKQWKYGEKLINPLITFTKELKAGLYDEMSEEDIEFMHQAALDLSGLWRSQAEVTADNFKSNLGYMLVQETIIRMVGSMKAADCDMKALFSALSWDENC